mmetsp:Transcript_29418/g.69972  ORF Transcript_29418/g.69972 Transcript_29418/m.69972 type:complete len:468 (-) Transcript_29418:1792-3195(-)
MQRVVEDLAEHRAGLDRVVAKAVHAHRNLLHVLVAVLHTVPDLRRRLGGLGDEGVVLVVEVLEAAHGDARGHRVVARGLVVGLHLLGQVEEGRDVEEALEELGGVVVEEAQGEVELVVEALHKRDQVRRHLDGLHALVVHHHLRVRLGHLVGDGGRALAGGLLGEVRVVEQNLEEGLDVALALGPEAVLARGHLDATLLLHLEADGHVGDTAALHGGVELGGDEVHEHLRGHAWRELRRRQQLQLRDLVLLRRALLPAHRLDLLHPLLDVVLGEHHLLLDRLLRLVLVVLLRLLLTHHLGLLPLVSHLLEAVVVTVVACLHPLADAGGAGHGPGVARGRGVVIRPVRVVVVVVVVVIALGFLLRLGLLLGLLLLLALALALCALARLALLIRTALLLIIALVWVLHVFLNFLLVQRIVLLDVLLHRVERLRVRLAHLFHLLLVLAGGFHQFRQLHNRCDIESRHSLP